MKNKQIHTVETIPKSNIKIVEKAKSIARTHEKIHNRSLFWLGTGTSIKCGILVYNHYCINQEGCE